TSCRTASGFPLVEATPIYLTVIQQAVAYQIEFSRYHPKLKTPVISLLSDHCNFILPNVVLRTFSGHTNNVKGVEFVGEEGLQIVSGSSDNTVRLWDTGSGQCLRTWTGHTSRVWDVAKQYFWQYGCVVLRRLQR
ncbi:hypothetical protein BVRB_038790, partial [Beta vulgaris subsp. vulgaris]